MANIQNNVNLKKFKQNIKEWHSILFMHNNHELEYSLRSHILILDIRIFMMNHTLYFNI